MDEETYRYYHQALTERSCPFAAAILSNRCYCEKSERLYLAERESGVCRDTESRERCLLFYQHLRRNARFALRLLHAESRLTYAQEMKIQCGGLLGIQAAMNQQAGDFSKEINIDALLKRAAAIFEKLETMPYAQIISYIRCYRYRHR